MPHHALELYRRFQSKVLGIKVVYNTARFTVVKAEIKYVSSQSTTFERPLAWMRHNGYYIAHKYGIMDDTCLTTQKLSDK